MSVAFLGQNCRLRMHSQSVLLDLLARLGQGWLAGARVRCPDCVCPACPGCPACPEASWTYLLVFQLTLSFGLAVASFVFGWWARGAVRVEKEKRDGDGKREHRMDPCAVRRGGEDRLAPASRIGPYGVLGD
eukprot:6488506-Amphidinium_carterae.1